MRSANFSVYMQELLLLHGKNERLSSLLSGAAYRLKTIPQEVTQLKGKDLSKLFQPAIRSIIKDPPYSHTLQCIQEVP